MRSNPVSRTDQQDPTVSLRHEYEYLVFFGKSMESIHRVYIEKTEKQLKRYPFKDLLKDLMLGANSHSDAVHRLTFREDRPHESSIKLYIRDDDSSPYDAKMIAWTMKGHSRKR